MEGDIKLSIEEGKYLYKNFSEYPIIRDIVLRAYSEYEVNDIFRDITTFEKACSELYIDYNLMRRTADNLAKTSKASAAMFKLNIIRRALNLGRPLYLMRNTNKNEILSYPEVYFMESNSNMLDYRIKEGTLEIIGSFCDDGHEYEVIGGDCTSCIGRGIGNYLDEREYSLSSFASGLFGCGSEEIARHFSRYFGMLMIEAKYGDIIKGFEVSESKYTN